MRKLAEDRVIMCQRNEATPLVVRVGQIGLIYGYLGIPQIYLVEILSRRRYADTELRRRTTVSVDQSLCHLVVGPTECFKIGVTCLAPPCFVQIHRIDTPLEPTEQLLKPPKKTLRLGGGQQALLLYKADVTPPCRQFPSRGIVALGVLKQLASRRRP